MGAGAAKLIRLQYPRSFSTIQHWPWICIKLSPRLRIVRPFAAVLGLKVAALCAPRLGRPRAVCSRRDDRSFAAAGWSLAGVAPPA